MLIPGTRSVFILLSFLREYLSKVTKKRDLESFLCPQTRSVVRASLIDFSCTEFVILGATDSSDEIFRDLINFASSAPPRCYESRYHRPSKGKPCKAKRYFNNKHYGELEKTDTSISKPLSSIPCKQIRMV